MFRRNTFTPPAIIFAIISGDSVAGPSVAIILVFLIPEANLGERGCGSKFDEFGKSCP
jgi:hypothetical protein